jgi:hypothetical protein
MHPNGMEAIAMKDMARPMTRVEQKLAERLGAHGAIIRQGITSAYIFRDGLMWLCRLPLSPDATFESMPKVTQEEAEAMPEETVQRAREGALVCIGALDGVSVEAAATIQ